ncbi:MAG: flagellar basal body-associated FliL family protein [Anaerolineales bacterium]|nr:flagellar basal body-associated FliL family protein [Anaerolineales bacterium]
MGKIMGIIGKVLVGLVLFTTFALNLGIVYLLFTPDTFPKPIHLTYPGSGAESGATEEAVVSSAAVEQETESGNEVASVPEPRIEVLPGQGIMINTGTKVINLADPTGRKYLRTTVVLEFAPEDYEYYSITAEEQEVYLTTFIEELNARMPIINDCITTILSSKTFEDVYTMEGKDILRVELVDALNERMPEHVIIYAYFTEFVVQ